MKVKSIELINVKCYENSIIEFSKNINLLVGANNSGKSTIIKSLMNLQYGLMIKSDIRSTKQYSKIYTSLTEISDIETKSFYHSQYPKELETGSEYMVCWGMSNNDQPEEHYYYDSKLKVERIENNRVKISEHDGTEVLFKHFPRFSDNENKNNFIYPFLAKRKTDYYDTNMGQDQTFKVSDSLRYLAAKIQKIGNPMHPMNKEFTSICEDILEFKIGVIPVDNNTNGNEPGIYTNNSSMIPLRSMGDGVANIVGFIVILLTENNKLFLIEELENDIHPKALKKLLNLIIEKSNNNQFVISTHSNIVLKYLGAVPKSKIFYVDWKPYVETDGAFENIPTSTIKELENKPENRIEVLKKLGYDFFDFELHESYLILEESSAEYIIRDFLIPNFVPNLYGRIKTIAAKGVDDLEARVQDFNRLFVFIHTSPIYYKKAWVIADGDKAGKTCIETLQKDFLKWPKEHFLNFSRNNFEEYYPRQFQEKVKEILEIKHGPKKQMAKTKLLFEVMQWALKNREDAKVQFNNSAADVIRMLQEIDKKMI